MKDNRYRYRIGQKVFLPTYADGDGVMCSHLVAKVVARRHINGRVECLVENNTQEGWADERKMEPFIDSRDGGSNL